MNSKYFEYENQPVSSFRGLGENLASKFRSAGITLGIAIFATALVVVFTSETVDWVYRIGIGFALVFVALVIVNVFRQNQNSDSSSAIISGLHHDFNQLIKEQLTLLRTSKKENLKKLTSAAYESANLLSDALTALNGFPIHVHIKDYQPSKEGIQEYPEAELSMLCLSNGNDRTRFTRANRHKVSENTHIQMALTSEEGAFFSNDFEQFVEEYNVENEEEFQISAKFWRKNYGTLLVVPILNKDHQSKSSGEAFNNYGMIFCDSPTKNAIREKHIEASIEMTKAFADGICALFEEFTRTRAEAERERERKRQEQEKIKGFVAKLHMKRSSGNGFVSIARGKKDSELISKQLKFSSAETTP